VAAIPSRTRAADPRFTASFADLDEALDLAPDRLGQYRDQIRPRREYHGGRGRRGIVPRQAVAAVSCSFLARLATLRRWPADPRGFCSGGSARLGRAWRGGSVRRQRQDSAARPRHRRRVRAADSSPPSLQRPGAGRLLFEWG